MEAGYAMTESSPVKKKKLNFFKRWIIGVVKDSWESERMSNKVQREEIVGIKQLSIGNSNSIDQPDRALHFTIYNANGGRIVETRKYDRQKDRHTNGLYVITGDQDFGREIDKIVTMEALK